MGCRGSRLCRTPEMVHIRQHGICYYGPLSTCALAAVEPRSSTARQCAWGQVREEVGAVVLLPSVLGLEAVCIGVRL